MLFRLKREKPLLLQTVPSVTTTPLIRIRRSREFCGAKCAMMKGKGALKSLKKLNKRRSVNAEERTRKCFGAKCVMMKVERAPESLKKLNKRRSVNAQERTKELVMVAVQKKAQERVHKVQKAQKAQKTQVAQKKVLPLRNLIRWRTRRRLRRNLSVNFDTL